MFLIIVAFIVGVFVGYKYPQQVEQVTQWLTKLWNDVKDKFSKKEGQK
jgi:hypothetical protein